MKLKNTIVYVKSMPRAAEFYQKLGFSVAQNSGKIISFVTDNPDQYFSVMEFRNSKRKPGMQLCTLMINNLEGFYKKCKLLGIPFEQDLDDNGFGKVFAIVDPDGNRIEFMEDTTKNGHEAADDTNIGDEKNTIKTKVTTF